MLLTVENIGKTFNLNKATPKKVLSDVSFTLDNKEILVLLGTNGAGKTTTIKSILGLVETDNGKVLFHDRDVKADDFKKIHQESAALLENATNLVDELSLIDNFVYWGLMRGIAKTEALKRGTEILTRFGLTDKKDTPINELSRGMQQSAAICMTLIAHPQLVIMDEPTLGLDINAVNEVIALIKELAQVQEMGIIITTHDLDFAEKIADKVGFITNGTSVKPQTEAWREEYERIASRALH